jgi:two-component system, OmpR family, phosphate regulon sensor histidine kinase PhoR
MTPLSRRHREDRSGVPSTTAEAPRRALSAIDLLVENLSDGVILLDNTGRVLDSNAAAERLFGGAVEPGVPVAELATRGTITTPDGTSVPSQQLPSARALRGEAVHGAELCLTRPDGSSAHLSVSASPVRVDDAPAVLLILNDISDRVRRDREAAAFRTLAQQLASAEQDLDAVYRTIVARIAEITGARVVRLMLYDGLARRLRLAAGHGLPESAPASYPLDDGGLEALSARTRLPVVVPNFLHTTADAVTEARPGSESAIVVPLSVHNELIGTLSYDLAEPHAFDDGEIAFLGTIATQSAIAIHNAAAYQQRNRERSFLHDIIDHLPALLVVFDVIHASAGEPPALDYRVTMLNSAAARHLPALLAARMAGPHGELPPIRRIARSPQARKLLSWLDDAVTSGEIVSAEEVPFDSFAAIGRDAPVRYWNGAIVPLRGPTGVVRELMLLATDVSEQVATRRRVEELVRIAGTRAAEIEATVSAMTDAVIVCDADGRIQLANRAALETFGVESISELQRLPQVHERVHPRHTSGEPVAPEERPLEIALAGETHQMDITLFHHTQGRDVHRRVNAAPVRDSGGQIIGAVSVETDITSLIEVDRLKDEFFSMAAHELRTPLTAIKGYTQILDKLMDRRAEVAERALRTIREQSDRMERLINELLDVARVQTGQLEFRYQDVELVALLRQLIAEIAPTAPQHTFHLQLDPPDAFFQGRWDRDRLTQVFANLLTNAVRYSPEGGEIDVMMEWSVAEAGAVSVSVSDPGIGIPPEQIPRLFARYSRVSDGRHFQTGGLGLGLYISKEIIDAHRGTIRVSSTPGHGSTFTVTLPTRSVPRKRPPARASRASTA